ncbi:conserved oligomeric Golgi complex subunit 2-like [Dysidea avara]|uniref:conserved oligomeric Golgi complex subunit 2-like n=1 Tax=Dysidea avara TaxID=196820 RepID=UPI0033261931
MSLSNQHPMIKMLESRIRSIDQVLESKLEKMFISYISASPDKLAQCLKTYPAIGKQQTTEESFWSQVVTPYMDGVLTSRNFNSKSHDLSLLYAEVLNFFPAYCQSLLQDVSHTSSHTHSNQQGFDFLVNAVFPKIVHVIEMRLTIIFASGNPDVFYKNYKKTNDFIGQFESLCATKNSIQRPRSHTSYSSFLNKWSFPIYYQIRFQEIAGHVEGILSGSSQLLHYSC